METDNLNLFISSKPVSLREARPGLLYNAEAERIVYKTEYSDQDSTGEYRPICYNSAGERWHGDYDTTMVYLLEI